MSKSKHTLNELLTKLMVDVNNMNAFLFSLKDMLETKSDNVSIEQTLDDGSKSNITVPSFGYLKSKVDALDDTFNRLISNNDDVIGIKSSNGDVRKFELKQISRMISELEDVESTEFEVPTDFRVKNNWFFESFLNPLLFISIDVSSVLTESIDKFAVKRIIINSINDDELKYFDDNYKNKNDISLKSLMLDLEANGIDYIEDDNIVDMPTGINRYKGTFDVLRIYEEEVTETLGTGSTVSVVRRKYKLNTLFYTDLISGEEGSKTLAVGDILLTQDDAEYLVTSIDVTTKEVVLERKFGIKPVSIGANVFRIKPEIYRVPELQVNVGYNERQVIFFKPINKTNNITVSGYSNGIGIFTNELKIQLDDQTETTLEQYYNNFVSDFGMILLNAAKEKKLPSIVGVIPDAPTLNADNFKVVQIDKHIKDDENVEQLQGKIKEKEELNSQKKEIDRNIEKLKSKLTTTAKTDAEKQRIEKTINKKIKDRKVLQDRLSTVVKDITLNISNTPQFVRSPKFRVRGFWNIPEPKTSKYGKQEVVQFKYRYRYLSKKGSAPNATQSEIVDENGNKKFAVFSPWTEGLTKARKRVLNEETGLYEWAVENVSDADEVNINQIDIPIKKGEIVEIQVKSLSEAGWPENPMESEWSNAIQVEFPSDIESAEEGTVISQKIFAEEAKISFEDELSAKGLDLHLGDQFQTGERFFAHKADSIASGFYTPEGNIIDLYQKLKEQESEIQALKQAITLAKGVIKVSLIDDNGNVSEVSNGQTLNIFAGYYKDLIKDTSSGSVVYNEGKVISKQYTISIQNTSETPLELISTLNGGIDELVPSTNPIAYPDSDYHTNRRYDVVPIIVSENLDGAIGGFKHTSGFQSGQVKSQYMYSRFKEYGLSKGLYENDPVNGQYFVNASYAYDGTSVNGTIVPYNWGHYLPYDPTIQTLGSTTLSTDSSVWNGSTDTSGVPLGNGYLSEFCIHKDHPYISGLGNNYNISSGNNLENLFRPKFSENVNPPLIDQGAKQKYLPFSHALHFETSEDEITNVFDVEYLKQAERVTPNVVTDNSVRADDNYPIKAGFNPEDEYLIGKYTCGAYLLMFPPNYSTISVEGNVPGLSKKTVNFGSDNALNIPFVFQFRCSDKLGYIGGFRLNETLTNIKYTKKMGIDIYIKDDVPFSFDIQVSCSYKKQTSASAPVVTFNQTSGNVTF